MAKTTNAPALTAETNITLTPSQVAHFTEGDGLFFSDPKGKLIAFAHADNLDKNSAQQIDGLHDAKAIIRFLIQGMLQGNERLELDTTSQYGLGQIFMLLDNLVMPSNIS